ncbi:MAG: hypothetical protein JJT88_04050 [Gammaproteobacteria bacterium]|nr:hypothetical protein [Gammaproteobacteria bacterium]
MTTTQASRLLPALFEHVDNELPLKVLDLGPALPETVAFFSGFRCKLHFADLYPELPLRIEEDDSAEQSAGVEGLARRLEEALALPGDVSFDTVFFWDVLNFMSRDSIGVLVNKLRPHLHPGSRAHSFAVHSSRMETPQMYHGIVDDRNFSVRTRQSTPPDYQPHSQGELESLLQCFRVDRSVLLQDKRVEVLLKFRST